MSVEHSPRILKASSVRGLGSENIFDYGDLRQQCDDYLEQTRRQAGQLLDDARRDSEEIRRQAHEEGRAAGLREGLATAAQDIQHKATQLAEEKALEKLETTFPALQAAAGEMIQERDRWLSRWETAAVGLGVAIAEKILHRQLALTPDIAVELVRQTLDLVAGTTRLRLRMNPSDVELLGAHAANVVEAAASCGEVEIAPDQSVTRGGCLIETQHGTVDAQLETQLARIMSELVEQHS